MRLLKCIDPFPKELKKNKVYLEVPGFNNGWIYVINENGNRSSYFSSRFIEVKKSNIYELW